MKDLLKQPIIFVGVPRAGTTIISEVIFQHNELAWISNYQDRFPSNVGINKVRPLLDNKLWRLSGQKQQLNKVPFYNKIAFKPAEAYGFWESITGNTFNFSKNFLLGQTIDNSIRKKETRIFFNKLVKYQKKKRLAFKITGPSRIEFLASIFPDALFIEVQREPFSNIRSLLKVPFWENLGKYELWWEGVYSKGEVLQASKWKSKPALITALQYQKIRKITQEEVKKIGVKHYVVSFEDFIKQPEAEIDKILNFVQLEKDKRIDDYFFKNKIYNRNKDAKTFFSKEEQIKIKKLLGE